MWASLGEYRAGQAVSTRGEESEVPSLDVVRIHAVCVWEGRSLVDLGLIWWDPDLLNPTSSGVQTLWIPPTPGLTPGLGILDPRHRAQTRPGLSGIM